MEQDIYKNGIGLIRIADIIVGDRLRSEPGDIDSLMYSIDTYGQLDPILVKDAGNGKFELIAGGQRILAFKKLDRTKILARLYETLDEEEKVAIELESDVRRTNLSWADQAKAIAKLVEIKQKKHLAQMPTRFGGGSSSSKLTQKEIASELNMYESELSEQLRIAKGLEEHPAIEFVAENRKHALKMVRDGNFDKVLSGGLKHKAIEESYMVTTPYQLLEQLENQTADLIILDPEEPSNKLFKTCFLKLKVGGSIVIFSELKHIPKWESYAESMGMYCLAPSIWHIKSDDFYLPFIWMGKNRERPLRLFPAHISCTKNKNALHVRAKPYKLMQQIVKNCTEPGAFVLIPECYDIESIKCCIDADRNVRAACKDKILRDKLIINL